MTSLPAFLTKFCQILEPGTSEHDINKNFLEHITDDKTAYSKVSYWHDLVHRNPTPRRVGWSREILKEVLDAIMDKKSHPLQYVADKFNLGNSKDILEWSLLDAKGHYADFINPDELKAVLKYYSN